MNKITAPYNFVPLNKYVYTPDWGGQVTQDIPFSDGEDGVIEVKWRNVSPLCIRDASGELYQYKDEEGKPREAFYSMHVKQPDGRRLYFLPGSSLRGMLRNTLNIMSFGKMTQYDDKYFGHREFDNPKNPKEKFGWLEKNGDVYKLSPCDYDVDNDKRSIKGFVEANCGAYNKTYTSSWSRNEHIRNSLWGKNNTDEKRCYFPIVYSGGRDCALFATGWMANKKHELLIPLPKPGTGKKLNDDVIESFKRMYENTPDVKHFLELLEGGTKIPVSYMLEDEDKVSALGLSHMLRQPYKHSIGDLVKKGQKAVTGRDLSELIFGYVDEKAKKVLKGRVQIGNAFAAESMSDEELKKNSKPVKGVLGEPKASYSPLYVKQDDKGIRYKTYDNGEISGRKLYRIHHAGSVTELPSGNDNEETVSRMIPVPVGQEFTMRIVVHNLRKVEIGALLSAILHHCTKGVYHNIGSAKGYGYGKLECNDDDVTFYTHFKYDKKEYLKEFERQMDNFIHKESKQKNYWHDSAELMRMMAILSEHSCPNDVRMMMLDEYTRAKRQKSAFAQSNEEKPVRSFLLLEKKYPDYGKDRDEVKQLMQSREWGKAKSKQTMIVDRLRAIDKELPELKVEQSVLKSIEEEETLLQQEQKSKEVSQQIERLHQAIIKRLLVTFYGILHEPYPGQPNKYKVNAWKICNSKVKSWLNKQERNDLNEEEKQALEATIRRLYANPDKKEKKEWEKADGNLWKQIAGFLGHDRAEQLYKELHG